MLGQWYGITPEGTHKLRVISNIEYDQNQFTGNVTIADDQNADLFCDIHLEQFTDTYAKGILSNFRPFDPHTSMLITREEYVSKFGTQIPTTGVFEGKISQDIVVGDWKTDISSYGNFRLFLSSPFGDSAFSPEVITWSEYKRYIESKDTSNFIYRGQPNTLKLSTSFHRYGRCDLFKFLASDLPEIRRIILTQSNHKFNLSDGEELGAFVSLLQHHGYPTPLLDWTESPYIAGFFAFDGLINDVTDYVSIFELDSKEWSDKVYRWGNIIFPEPVLAVSKFLGYDNPRMIPQQAVSLFSNFCDVEWVIKIMGDQHSYQYLKIFRIPRSEIVIVKADLNKMGITPASMYPGLDGVCRLMKLKLFSRYLV